MYRSTVGTGQTQSLTIERTQGLKLSSQVSYSTVESSSFITVGQLTFAPALASVHFTSVTGAIVPFAVDIVSSISYYLYNRSFTLTISIHSSG